VHLRLCHLRARCWHLNRLSRNYGRPGSCFSKGIIIHQFLQICPFLRSSLLLLSAQTFFFVNDLLLPLVQQAIVTLFYFPDVVHWVGSVFHRLECLVFILILENNLLRHHLLLLKLLSLCLSVSLRMNLNLSLSLSLRMSLSVRLLLWLRRSEHQALRSMLLRSKLPKLSRWLSLCLHRCIRCHLCRSITLPTFIQPWILPHRFRSSSIVKSRLMIIHLELLELLLKVLLLGLL